MDVPDYKEMYLTLIRASEKAMNGLIAAQQECEAIYIGDPSEKKKTKEEGH